MVRRGRRSGLYTIVAVHSTVRGPSLGGCRMWGYGDARAAVRDALRLSRAMTFKSAVAGLPLGGGKGVIMLPAGAPPPAGDGAATCCSTSATRSPQLDGRYVTAEDVGTSDADMTVIAERRTHVAGLAPERGGSGDPSPWTALGVEAAIRVAAERVWGTGDLAGRSVAVIGLGHVGGTLARSLAAAGARLVVADVAAGRRALADELGAEWIEPDGGAARGRRHRRAVRARRCARPRHGARAALPRRRRRGEQPARVRGARRRAARARDPLGAGLRGQRGRDHQHRRRARGRAATTPSAPASACSPSATRCAPCSTSPRPSGRPRSRPRRRSRALAWPDPTTCSSFRARQRHDRG